MFLVNFLIIMLAYKLWGKKGLFAYMAGVVIVANIQVTKTVKLFGLTATLGNIVYASSFLITDILTEVHSEEDSRQAVWIGFLSMTAMTALMWLGLKFVPAPSDWAQPHLQAIFSIMPRIVLGSFIGYLVSNFHDVWAFGTMRKKMGKKWLWLRNNLSTMVSQGIDSVLFCFIALWGTMPMSVFWQVLFTTYILKWGIASLDTPFVYWARRMKEGVFDN